MRKNNWKINDSRVRIKNADNRIRSVIGVTDPLKIDVKGNAVKMPLLVLEHDHDDVLLGLDWLRKTRAKFVRREHTRTSWRNSCYRPGSGKKTIEDCFVEVEVIDDLNFAEEFDWHDLEGRKIIPPENLGKNQMSIFKALIEENLEIFATGLADLRTCKIGRIL